LGLLKDERPEQFKKLLDATFKFFEDVMAMPLDPDEKTFSKVLGVKQQAAAAILGASVRVDSGDLRKRNRDRLGALLEEVRSET
jgi:hypothetical protein